MPEQTLAGSLMSPRVTSFSPDTELLAAARILFDNRWGGAPVLVDGEVVSVLSLADVIAQRRSLHTPQPLILFDALLYLGSRRFEKELKKVTAMTVGDAMTSPAVTVTPKTLISDVAAIMIDRGLATLPVLEDGKLVGVIGRRDVVRLILGDTKD